MKRLGEALEHIKSALLDGRIEESYFKGETTLIVPPNKLKDILTFLKQTPSPGFESLMDLTGVDYLVPTKRTQVVYLLHNPETLERIRIATFVERDGEIPSIIDLWEGADWYERELYDLFGVTFSGHAKLQRILMPDDWKGHPLRKDYALTEESVEFKNDVFPKVPSEIISYDKQKQKS